LLNRAVWDGEEAISVVCRFVVEGLSVATGRRRRGLVVGALDETGQQKRGSATAAVKRQYMGCAGRVENGITVYSRAWHWSSPNWSTSAGRHVS
jgi:SRSO17 transposase